MLAWVLGCDAEPEPEAACPEVEWPEPVTTLTARVESDPRLDAPSELNPAFPDGLAEAERIGLGGTVEVSGEAWTLRDELVPGWAAPAVGRRSLWMVFHQSDAQIADTESPTRLAAADLPSATESAARPQELYALHALDALVRRANGLHARVGIDFAVATGDNADSDQENELRWFAAVLDGTPVHPDSGEDDAQPEPDGCADPVAPFVPVGLAFPWYAVAGNHDVLVQGNFDNGLLADDALGSVAIGGTRDLSLPGGPLTFATVPDPERRLLERSDIAAILLESPSVPGPPGHGSTDANVRDDSVGWAVDPVEGVPVRLIAVDANPPDIGSPVLTAAERDGWLLPELARAEADGVLVVLTSHYALGGVAVEGGGTVGDLLLEHENVVLVLAGHSHQNAIRAFGSPGDAAGFWQIETASSVDQPGQGRLVELVDNGDGTLSVVTTVFDYPTPPGSLAARAAELMWIDWQSGWRVDEGRGEPADRNTELVQGLPASWAGGAGTEGVRSAGLP